MNEVKKNFSKWMYWFLLAVAIILVYKFLDNFTAIGNAIGSAIGGALGSIGKSKKKLEAEKMYYSLVYEVLDEVIC